MTSVPGNRAWVALGIVLSASFALLAHAAIVERLSPVVGAALSVVPLTLLALVLLRRSRHRVLIAALVGLAAAALWLARSDLERHFTDLFFLEHAGMNLALAIVFGRTLAPGSEPLVTRFARIVHGSLAPEVERYSRAVTFAWTALFATIFTLSCVLYLGQLRAAWSVLVNFVSPGAVVAMFAIEYFVRHRVLPGHERVGILGGVRAFSRHFASPR